MRMFLGPAAVLLSCASPRATSTAAPTSLSVSAPAPIKTATLHDAAIAKKVKEIIRAQLEVSEEQLLPQASFVCDLKADSLAVVELVLAFEQEFKILIPEEDAQEINTVQDAIRYIQEHAK